MRAAKPLFLALIGGLLYLFIELLWRGHSHWAMVVVGGLCFYACGEINELMPWEVPLSLQALIGGAVITVLELLAGLYLNVMLRLGVWDYSDMPFNFMGQICLPFSVAWVLLACAAIVLDDWLRHWLFGEERPHYRI